MQKVEKKEILVKGDFYSEHRHESIDLSQISKLLNWLEAWQIEGKRFSDLAPLRDHSELLAIIDNWASQAFQKIQECELEIQNPHFNETSLDHFGSLRRSHYEEDSFYRERFTPLQLDKFLKKKITNAMRYVAESLWNGIQNQVKRQVGSYNVIPSQPGAQGACHSTVVLFGIKSPLLNLAVKNVKTETLLASAIQHLLGSCPGTCKNIRFVVDEWDFTKADAWRSSFENIASHNSPFGAVKINIDILNGVGLRWI